MVLLSGKTSHPWIAVLGSEINVLPANLREAHLLKRREIGFPDDEIGIMREREREAKFGRLASFEFKVLNLKA